MFIHIEYSDWQFVTGGNWQATADNEGRQPHILSRWAGATWEIGSVVEGLYKLIGVALHNSPPCPPNYQSLEILIAQPCLLLQPSTTIPIIHVAP